MNPVKLVLVLISLAAFAWAAAGFPTGRVGAVAVGLFAWEASAYV